MGSRIAPSSSLPLGVRAKDLTPQKGMKDSHRRPRRRPSRRRIGCQQEANAASRFLHDGDELINILNILFVRRALSRGENTMPYGSPKSVVTARRAPMFAFGSQAL